MGVKTFPKSSLSPPASSFYHAHKPNNQPKAPHMSTNMDQSNNNGAMSTDSIRSDFSTNTASSSSVDGIKESKYSISEAPVSKASSVITETRPGDVLFGRGRPFQTHPGNKHMHDMADKYKVQYAKMRSVDKRKVTLAIVKCIQKEYNGRFLRPTDVPKSEVDNSRTYWTEVTDLEAQHKVRHTIRSRLRDDELKGAAMSPTTLEIDDDFKIEFKPNSVARLSPQELTSGLLFAEQMELKTGSPKPKKVKSNLTGSNKNPTKIPTKVKMAAKMAPNEEWKMMPSPITRTQNQIPSHSQANFLGVEQWRRQACLLTQANRDLLGRNGSSNYELLTSTEPRLVTEMPSSCPDLFQEYRAPLRFLPGELSALHSLRAPSTMLILPIMSQEECMLRVRLAEMQAEREAVAAMALAESSMMG